MGELIDFEGPSGAEAQILNVAFQNAVNPHLEFSVTLPGRIGLEHHLKAIPALRFQSHKGADILF
jgi:hypothetical protein